MGVLCVAVVKAILGGALEESVGGMAELLRLVVRHAQGPQCVALLRYGLHNPPASDQPQVLQVRGPLLALLEQKQVAPLSDYRERAMHLWGFCQGRHGLDALTAPPDIITGL
jgi:hypothetical protein